MQDLYDYESSEFLKKNRHFFKNYKFNFEGLDPSLENNYIRLFEYLGATISNDKDAYTLTEYSYLIKDENKERTDLYNIIYFLDSLNVGKPLDINAYRHDNYDKNVGISPSWWFQTEVLNEKDQCQIENCTYEPQLHYKHKETNRSIMSEAEKKIIIKYLILNNAIKNCKGLTIYKKMINCGYLSHRTANGLRRQVTRIIPTIEKYGLPLYIVKQFKSIYKSR